MQQAFVASELITREQTAKQPNRHFEILNVNVFVERKILGDVLARVIRFVFQSH